MLFKFSLLAKLPFSKSVKFRYGKGKNTSHFRVALGKNNKA